MRKCRKCPIISPDEGEEGGRGGMNKPSFKRGLKMDFLSSPYKSINPSEIGIKLKLKDGNWYIREIGQGFYGGWGSVK